MTTRDERAFPCRRGAPEWSVVVAGVPRSGTSLMMQMLAAGGLAILADERRRPDADNPRGYFEFEPARRLSRDASWLSRAGGKAFKLVHTLVPALPPDRSYRVILMHRRLAEVVQSQQRMLERRGAGPGASGLSDARLIEIFEQQLRDVAAWVEAQPNAALLRVDYNALLAAPRAGAEAVRDVVPVALDIDAMARCVDPALYRERCS